MKQTLLILALTMGFAVVGQSSASAQVTVRIKDIAHIEGVRKNTLTGLGLVTGLSGTGGKNPITRQFALNLQQQFGVRADPLIRAGIRNDARDKTDNLSVVTVTAELPSFAKPGSRLDVMVAAFDDAKSLQGGQLILTELYGADGEVYATANGTLSTGGFSFSGDAGSVQKNHPTVGRITGGAVVEEVVCAMPIGQQGFVRLLLRQSDYETCRRIANAINQKWPESAKVVDSSTITVYVPFIFMHDVPRFLGLMTSLSVKPDVRARVVINERTGTVVVGTHVRISQVAITHANLSVVTGESPLVSQPAPFSRGETTVVPRTEIDVLEEDRKVNVIDETATVGDLAKALNSLGVTPRDLSAIFQQLKEAEALHAELILN